jgi:S-adenosylmethionine/arginine decarboxylase-like enzyme
MDVEKAFKEIEKLKNSIGEAFFDSFHGGEIDVYTTKNHIKEVFKEALEEVIALMEYFKSTEDIEKIKLEAQVKSLTTQILVEAHKGKKVTRKELKEVGFTRFPSHIGEKEGKFFYTANDIEKLAKYNTK